MKVKDQTGKEIEIVKGGWNSFGIPMGRGGEIPKSHPTYHPMNFEKVQYKKREYRLILHGKNSSSSRTITLSWKENQKFLGYKIAIGFRKKRMRNML